MTTITRDIATQSVHDQVVNLVAQRWARSWQCQITISSDEERARMAEAERNCADIIGWTFRAGKNKIEWVAEVETEESLAEAGTGRRWQDAVGLGVPLFVFVPKGRRAEAQAIALRANVRLNGVYEYAFVNGTFQLS
ncbi:MAG: hypothetical protein NNA24_00145 [Nitrospira sp.]|nr:hypothetical protein [Nitrospira sp.]